MACSISICPNSFVRSPQDKAVRMRWTLDSISISTTGSTRCCSRHSCSREQRAKSAFRVGYRMTSSLRRKFMCRITREAGFPSDWNYMVAGVAFLSLLVVVYSQIRSKLDGIKLHIVLYDAVQGWRELVGKLSLQCFEMLAIHNNIVKAPWYTTTDTPATSVII